MRGNGATELKLIRHAPALTEGRLCGRRDVDADLSERDALVAMATLAGMPTRLVVSPARRCQNTAAALWPGVPAIADATLLEQDFGAWEGLPLADLPDLGPLSTPDLARHRPPGGESFFDVCARVWPLLRALTGQTTIVAHAGTIRAALSLALGGEAAGLAFQIEPLSLTILSRTEGGAWSVALVNRTAR